MTICRFYANGYCRYGNNCRFEHIDGTTNYYQKNYNRNDGRQYQTNSAPKNVGFSFNRALDNINKGPTQSSSFFGGPSTGGQSSFGRNSFQLSRSTLSPTQPTAPTSGSGFSFNRTLQQISGAESEPIRSVNDIDMDMSANSIPQSNFTSRTSQANPFGQLPQTNSNSFANSSLATANTQLFGNAYPPRGQSRVSTAKSNEEIYSKSSELSETDIKSYNSNVFAFKSIPLIPPTQELCF